MLRRVFRIGNAIALTLPALFAAFVFAGTSAGVAASLSPQSTVAEFLRTGDSRSFDRKPNAWMKRFLSKKLIEGWTGADVSDGPVFNASPLSGSQVLSVKRLTNSREIVNVGKFAVVLANVELWEEPDTKIEQSSFLYYLVLEGGDWKVDDISYGLKSEDGKSLRSVLHESAIRAGEDIPSVVLKGIEEAKTNCKSGSLVLPKSLVKRVDLNNDGVLDYVLSFEDATCGGASIFCGTGGCLTKIYASTPTKSWVKVVDDILLNYESKIVKGRATLHLVMHGSVCGRSGPDVCRSTLYWNGNGFNPFN